MATKPTPSLTTLHSVDHNQQATTAEILIRALGRDSSSVALTVGERAFTRADLANHISQYAQAFEECGIGPGSAVAILAKSTPEALFAQFAAQIRGARVTMLSASASAEDLDFILADACIEFVIIDGQDFGQIAMQWEWARRETCRILTLGEAVLGDNISAVAQMKDPLPLVFAGRGSEGIGSIAYTGGTTGRPKGVVGTFLSSMSLTQIQMSEWEWPQQPKLLLCTPLTHAAGAFVVPVLLRGGSVIVMPHFDAPSVLAAIQEHKVNALFVVPTMLYSLLDTPDLAHYDTTCLQTIFYGAAPISPTRLADAIDHFGKIFFQFYGQTECGMTISVLRREEHTPERLGSCGRPVPWLDVALLDSEGKRVSCGEVAEICVRGPLVARGYWNRPDQTAEAFREGWLHTGDLGRFDEEGFLTIVDRTKDLIISGGFNVYSAEVESVIAAQDGVAEVAVIGIADAYWGESVTALVVAATGRTIDVNALTLAVRERKGAIHAPKNVVVIAALPRTPLGKVDKAAARLIATQMIT